MTIPETREPDRVARLTRTPDARNMPVPWFVAWIDGKPVSRWDIQALLPKPGRDFMDVEYGEGDEELAAF